MIIKIILEVSVIFDRLMESCERRIKEWSSNDSVGDCIHSQMQSIVYLIVVVLFVIRINSGGVSCGVETFFLSIKMNAPHGINFVVNSLVVAVSRDQCWCCEPKYNVLCFKFEHC